ncbi:MAG: tetratricopeptide repeat protein, partial [Bacteroidota bacterium]|nr:tetratricopeptide repeat protein [Bacteroidota bacterium]
AINGISAGYTYDSARWNEAAKLHEQAQTIYDSLNIAEQERAYLPAIVLSTPAIDNYKSKNFPKAILLLSIIKDNDLIPEKERLLAKQIYGKANGSVASELFSKNDYQSSIPYFEKSILYADSAAKAISSLELGLCYFHLKRYQTARNLFLQTETYANDEATKQMAYRFIGNAYYYESYPFEASQEYGNALKGYLAALNWFKKGGKPSAYVQALRNVAGIYNNTGEWEKSDSLYQIALQLALTAGDTMGIARTYFDIGCSYLKKSDYNQALKCFDNCYQRCLSIHDYPFALATLSRKVNLYLYNLNNDYMAFMCEKQCEELLKFMDPAQLTTFLPSLFSIQKDMQLNKGDYQGALASLEKLHAARRASIESKNGSVLDSIAEYPLYLKEKINLLHHLKRNDEIRSCIDSLLVAQKGYSPEKLAEESTSIGAIHLMIGDHEAAVADLKKSIQLFRQVDNNERRCEQSYYYMGIAYANLKKYTEAQTALEKALSINQSVKPAYNKDKEDILCTLANACAFGNNPAIAQSYYTQTVDVLK